MLEALLEIISVELFGGILKFIARVLSLVVIWVKNGGEKSVKEIWSDKEALSFTGLNFIAQILTIVLLIVFIIFIIDVTCAMSKKP